MVVSHLRHYQKKNSSDNSVDYREGLIHWLQEQDKSPNTIKNYLCDLDAFSRWFAERLRRTAISQAHYAQRRLKSSGCSMRW